MKHARKDYNRIQDPENKIPEDEPVFLIRGQDNMGPKLLLKWASMLRLQKGDPKMARMVEDHAQEMIEWQKHIKVKRPDLPEDND